MATPPRTGGTSATGGYATTGNAGSRWLQHVGWRLPGDRTRPAVNNAKQDGPVLWGHH